MKSLLARMACAVLVDRLWPRGLTKERAAIDLWLKELAPSTELRKWFGHDPDKWKEFQSRYRKELRDKTSFYKTSGGGRRSTWSPWYMEPVMKNTMKPSC